MIQISNGGGGFLADVQADFVMHINICGDIEKSLETKHKPIIHQERKMAEVKNTFSSKTISWVNENCILALPLWDRGGPLYVQL